MESASPAAANVSGTWCRYKPASLPEPQPTFSISSPRGRVLRGQYPLGRNVPTSLSKLRRRQADSRGDNEFLPAFVESGWTWDDAASQTSC